MIINNKMRIQIFVLLAIALAPAAFAAQSASKPAASRPRDPQVAHAHDRYRSGDWRRGERKAGFDVGSLKIHNFDGSAVEVIGDNALARRFTATGAAKPLYLIESNVYEAVADAHEKLAEILAFVSSPGTLPTMRASGHDVGDIGYIGYSGAAPGRIAWLAFVRGNITVRVTNLQTSESPAIDAAAVAKLADNAILAAPTLLDTQSLPKPAIDNFTFDKNSVVAGKIVKINFSVSGVTGEPNIDWITGGTGMGYVERAATASGAPGNFELHATGAGAFELTARVTSPLGVSAEAKATIAIAAR